MSTGILGTRAGLVADVNLIAQIVILLLLSVGALQARSKHFDWHHGTMIAAVIVNAAAIVFIMNPSFFRLLPYALRNPGAAGPVIMLPHAAIGALAELLGIYIIARTPRNPSALSGWPSMKRTMIVTLLLWLVALSGGIWLYISRYV
jgi:hypothetical protein